jgi:hypothetical protein
MVWKCWWLWFFLRWKMFFHWRSIWAKWFFNHLTKLKWKFEFFWNGKLLSNKGFLKTYIKLLVYIYTNIQVCFSFIFIILVTSFNFGARIIHMWSLKLFKVDEILRVATFDIICGSKFATNCVDCSLPTPFRYSICLLLSNGQFYIAKTLNIWINFFEKIKLWTPHVPFLVSPKFVFTLSIFAFGSLFVGFLLFPSSVYSMAPTFEVVAICA